MTRCPRCASLVDPRRSAAGISLCLPCGDAMARKTVRTVAPMSKSNYYLITNPVQLKQLNKYAND